MDKMKVASELVKIAKKLTVKEGVISGDEILKSKMDYRENVTAFAMRNLELEQDRLNDMLRGKKVRRVSAPKSDVISKPIRNVTLALQSDFTYEIYIDNTLMGRIGDYEFYQ